MTENKALELDTAAHALAAVALCTVGSFDCLGRVPVKVEPDQPPPECVMRRAAGEYRLPAPAVGRRYLCRYCRAEHVFPVAPA